MVDKKDYATKRAEAVRELNHLRRFLLAKTCTVDTINRAFKLKKLYNL